MTFVNWGMLTGRLALINWDCLYRPDSCMMRVLVCVTACAIAVDVYEALVCVCICVCVCIQYITHLSTSGSSVCETSDGLWLAYVGCVGEDLVILQIQAPIIRVS